MAAIEEMAAIRAAALRIAYLAERAPEDRGLLDEIAGYEVLIAGARARLERLLRPAAIARPCTTCGRPRYSPLCTH